MAGSFTKLKIMAKKSNAELEAKIAELEEQIANSDNGKLAEELAAAKETIAEQEALIKEMTETLNTGGATGGKVIVKDSAGTKFEFKFKQVKFGGKTLNGNDLKADPTSVDALVKIGYGGLKKI
jgi:hypothetical protein